MLCAVAKRSYDFTLGQSTDSFFGLHPLLSNVFPPPQRPIVNIAFFFAEPSRRSVVSFLFS